MLNRSLPLRESREEADNVKVEVTLRDVNGRLIDTVPFG
jgi:hypothetical protein